MQVRRWQTCPKIQQQRTSVRGQQVTGCGRDRGRGSASAEIAGVGGTERAKPQRVAARLLVADAEQRAGQASADACDRGPHRRGLEAGRERGVLARRDTIKDVGIEPAAGLCGRR